MRKANNISCTYNKCDKNGIALRWAPGRGCSQWLQPFNAQCQHRDAAVAEFLCASSQNSQVQLCMRGWWPWPWLQECWVSYVGCSRDAHVQLNSQKQPCWALHLLHCVLCKAWDCFILDLASDSLVDFLWQPWLVKILCQWQWGSMRWLSCLKPLVLFLWPLVCHFCSLFPPCHLSCSGECFQSSY